MTVSGFRACFADEMYGLCTPHSDQCGTQVFQFGPFRPEIPVF